MVDKTIAEKLRLKKLRDDRREANLCQDCCEKLEDNFSRCKICRDKRSFNRRNRITEGKCNGCTNLLNGSKHASCEECRAKKRQKRKDRNLLGFCSYCDNKLESGNTTYCNACLEKCSQRTRNNLLAGKCRCGRLPIVRTSSCEICYLRATSHRQFGKSDFWQDLKSKFIDQKGICPYSGSILTLGVDTELDHIIPRSNNGLSNLDNTHWVHRHVNKMKWSESEEDFFSWIRKIYKYRNLNEN